MRSNGDANPLAEGCKRVSVLGMAAAERLDTMPSPTDSKAIADAVMVALSLVDQGVSYREAARRVGVHWSSVWHAAKRQEALQSTIEAGEDVGRRLVAKARVAAEMGVERILKEIATCHERYVAPWTLTAARLAGVVDGSGAGSDGITPTVTALLTALGTRTTLESTTRVTFEPVSPATDPVQLAVELPCTLAVPTEAVPVRDSVVRGDIPPGDGSYPPGEPPPPSSCA